jgi:hypothetical protein
MIYWGLGIFFVIILVIAIQLYDRHLAKKIDEWEKNQ